MCACLDNRDSGDEVFRYIGFVGTTATGNVCVGGHGCNWECEERSISEIFGGDEENKKNSFTSLG